MVRRKLLLFVAFCAACCITVQGQALPGLMSPPRLVNDFAGVMDAARQAALEEKLVGFDRETSTQIAVVTVSDLQGYEAADFAQRLHEKWGVGRAGRNNGILVLIKPKTDGSRGHAFISVGYGLEGVIPDITAGRIVENEILPPFRENDYYTGIDRGVGVLMQLSRGEFTADAYAGRKEEKPSALTAGMIIFLFIMILVLRISRKHPGSRGSGRPPIFMGGGWSGGGFGGGGFGGFGGGTSGGGGGGRSW